MYLEVSGVKKSYGEGGSYVQVLKGINTGVEKGQMCVIQGTSGSGKSTLLNCIGVLSSLQRRMLEQGLFLSRMRLQKCLGQSSRIDHSTRQKRL